MAVETPAGMKGQAFRYTFDEKPSHVRSGRLSHQQRSFYEQNGFVVVPNLVGIDLLDACEERFLDIINGKVERGGITMMKDISFLKQQGHAAANTTNERIINKLQDLCWDEVFSKYICHPVLLDYVENFTGPNIMAMHSMLINKPPDSGKLTSRHPLHQDLHYFPFRPAERIVASWTAMEPIDGNNGCLFVLPGSHLDGVLHRHEYPEWENGVNKMYHGIRELADEEGRKKELHMQKGDTVFFHPLLVHGSGSNVTSRFRKAISCHYASSDCHYIDVRGTSQESIAKEVDEIVRKRGVTDFTYQDVWHIRSRCVRGMEGKL